jgi:hypothetical protein
VPYLRGARITAQVLYPQHAGTVVSWDSTHGTLSVTLPRLPSACVLRLTHATPAA